MIEQKTKQFTWDYHEKSDILNVRNINKKSDGNAELGDFTVDFDNNGNVIGIEIMNASEFLGQVGITKKEIINLTGAELTVTQKNNNMFVWMILRLPHNIEKCIPLPTPIINEEQIAVVEA